MPSERQAVDRSRPCRGGATPGASHPETRKRKRTGSVEFCVNEQFCTDRVDPRAHHPIKSGHSRWLRPETRRGVNGDGLCTKHSAIATRPQNVCGPLNKRAIPFTAPLISLWPCPGSRSHVRMKTARRATHMRAVAPAATGSPTPRQPNERRPPIKVTCRPEAVHEVANEAAKKERCERLASTQGASECRRRTMRVYSG